MPPAPSHLPVFLAQTSPLSPVGPATSSPDEPFLFASVQFNLAQYGRQLALAAASAALRDGGVVVFPEYGLQGIIPDHSAYALPAPYLVKALQALCKHHQLAAVTTIVEPHARAAHPALPPSSPFAFAADGSGALEPATAAQRHEWAAYEQAMGEVGFECVNAAYYVSAEGEMVGRYEKANLWHPERDYLRPGSEPSAVFDTPWGRAGLVVCWDLSHPEAVQSLVRRGAEIVFAPTYWLSTDSDPMQRKYTPTAPLYDHALLPALAFVRAFESEVILVMGNPGVGSSAVPLPALAPAGSAFAALEQRGRDVVGRDNTYDAGFFGQSGVWAPLAGKVGDAGVDEGSWSGKVPLEVIQDARKTYKIVEEAQTRVDKAKQGSA